MNATELDGKYQVSSATSYDGPLKGKSDGATEIRNGETARTDASGVIWKSRFTILNEHEVEMISIADPSKARPGTALLKPDGSPSLEPVTYKATLKLARKGDRIQMSGQINYGNEIVFLTLRRVV